jgi:hypothetical protein
LNKNASLNFDTCLIRNVVVIVGNIVKIVTHHVDTRGAADAWVRDEVCAVGFVYDQSRIKDDREGIKHYMREAGRNEKSIPSDAGSFIRFRDDVQIGDLVFAYATENVVALVGEVAGEAVFDSENEVGGDYNYPNQRSVDWWSEPRFFDRKELPTDVSKWVKITGTILRREHDTDKLKEQIRKIQSGQLRDALETQDETEIADFIQLNIDRVEAGLVLIDREVEVGGKFLDFVCKDTEGTIVIIEVKQWGTPDSLTQLRGYMRDYRQETGNERVRGILVALDFSRRCIEDWEELAQAGFNINLTRAKKTFTFGLVEL